MSDGALHFMEIAVLPCKNPSLVTKDIQQAITNEALSLKNKDKTFWVLKVQCANFFVRS